MSPAFQPRMIQIVAVGCSGVAVQIVPKWKDNSEGDGVYHQGRTVWEEPTPDEARCKEIFSLLHSNRSFTKSFLRFLFWKCHFLRLTTQL